MNDLHSPLWTSLSSDQRITGTWRSALPVYHDQPSPCLGACPVNGRIAVWIGQLGAGDIRGAFETLADNNPFPAIAGRICHHPCETSCNRNQLDETVGICSLERFVGDTALAEGWGFAAPPVEHGVSVAVVGGGPAGLSAAYQLRRRGIRVTLIEAGEALGGLMRTGIPAYRLDRDVLEAEIARITALGIELKLGHAVVGPDEMKALRADHDAVFLATGASLPKRLPGLDYDQASVIDSADFLAAPREVQESGTGARVVVIGGGSAAMDVARSARRLGRAVTVLALEAEDALPAQATEVEEAREEGIAFTCGAMMRATRVMADGVALDCVRVNFTAGDAPGRFTIDEIAGSNFEIEADTIIPAIGQDADLARWDGLLEASGPAIAIGPDLQTGVPGIYAGGDVASMGRFVTHAVGMGKEAALAIADALLEGTTRYPGDAPLVDYGRINTAYHETHGRTRQPLAALETRLAGFAEVQQPLTPDQARTEAARCFSCGTCIYCDNCYFYCPDMAITRLDRGYEIKSDYCKGCGLCVAECPTGAIHMQEDRQS